MQYLIGAIIPIALFLCLYLGYKLGNRPKQPKLPLEEQLKQERKMKEFEDVMSYNFSKAVERKRV